MSRSILFAKYISNLVIYHRLKGGVNMAEKIALDEEVEFFSAERRDEIIILRLKQNLLLRAIDLRVRDKVLDYLDRVSKTDAIKVVVIISSPETQGSEEYFDFYHRVLTSKIDDKDVHRLHNVFSQIILRIVELNKIVVHASSGRVISLFLNVSLACDYRIVAEDTVFQNPYFKLGLVPIGGGAYFLSRRLGRSKALEILLAETDITPHEAKELGFVDKVVAPENLEKTALDVARGFAQKPAPSLAGLKKLINYSLLDLKDYMALEYQELIKALGDRLY